ncbi:MAG: hypothetical protein R3C05_01540 [Pirellulaceae bacterium]
MIHSSIVQAVMCVIGYPVAGNAMQFAMQRALNDAQLDCHFLSLNVHPEQFDDALRGVKALGFRGVALAEPFESRAAEFADELMPMAAKAQWVDSLCHSNGCWIGRNHLAKVVVERSREACPTASRAIILGNGEQAKAIAAGFECGQIEVVTVDDSADAFDESHDATYSLSDTVIIRADDDSGTPISLRQFPSLASAKPGCFVDTMIDPAETSSLSIDTAHVSGLDIVVARIAASFLDWTGHVANDDVLREAVEEYFEL